MPKKLGKGEWEMPKLWLDCPHCGYCGEYLCQWADEEMEIKVPLLAQLKKDRLKGVEFSCDSCGKEFGLKELR